MAAAAMNADNDRKIFVGGLSWSTDDAKLREYFGQFGEVANTQVKKDPATGKPRGFAFVTFTDPSGVQNVMATSEHNLDGKRIDPKAARSRPGKVFVGGLAHDATEDDVKEYFGQFGSISEFVMPFDKMKGHHKGFCFVTFESDQALTPCLLDAHPSIKGKPCEVKKAVPQGQEGMGGGRGGGGMGGGRGGGGMRGGRGGGMRGGGRGGGAGGYGGGYDQSAGYGGGYGGGYGAAAGYSNGAGYGGGYGAAAGGYDQSAGYAGYDYSANGYGAAGGAAAAGGAYGAAATGGYQQTGAAGGYGAPAVAAPAAGGFRGGAARGAARGASFTGRGGNRTRPY